MGNLRRLDHIGILVHDTDRALQHFSTRLGLSVFAAEEVPEPHVRLTYLDAGNTWLQLVQPLDSHSHVARSLATDGQGFHHLCFAVDDVLDTAYRLATDVDGGAPPVGSGLGRVSAFVPGEPAFGVRIECTEFRMSEVETSRGWLP